MSFLSGISQLFKSSSARKLQSGFADLLVVAAFVIVSAIIAIPVTYVANQTSTENRSRAAISCPGGTCPDGWSYGADGNAPQSSCAQRASEACAGHQKASNPAPTAKPAPTAAPSTGNCVSTGCTYYSCTQQLLTNSCGARTLSSGLCKTNYPSSDPCKVNTTPATAVPATAAPSTGTAPSTGGCPTGKIQCGGCLNNLCYPSSEGTCNEQIQKKCNTNTTCAGNGVAPTAGQACCSPYVLYSNGRCGAASTACIGDGGSKPVSGGTCCANLKDCGSSCVASTKACPGAPTPSPTPKPTVTPTKTALTSCSEPCFNTAGCTCPTTCVNASVSSYANSCGGLKATPTPTPTVAPKKTALTSCSEPCFNTAGCTCPTTCVNASVSSYANSCGGLKVTPTPVPTPVTVACDAVSCTNAGGCTCDANCKNAGQFFAKSTAQIPIISCGGTAVFSDGKIADYVQCNTGNRSCDNCRSQLHYRKDGLDYCGTNRPADPTAATVPDGQPCDWHATATGNLPTCSKCQSGGYHEEPAGSGANFCGRVGTHPSPTPTPRPTCPSSAGCRCYNPGEDPNGSASTKIGQGTTCAAGRLMLVLAAPTPTPAKTVLSDCFTPCFNPAGCTCPTGKCYNGNVSSYAATCGGLKPTPTPTPIANPCASPNLCLAPNECRNFGGSTVSTQKCTSTSESCCQLPQTNQPGPQCLQGQICTCTANSVARTIATGERCRTGEQLTMVAEPPPILRGDAAGDPCSSPHGSYNSSSKLYCCTSTPGAQGFYSASACSGPVGWYAFGNNLPDGTWCSPGNGCTRCQAGWNVYYTVDGKSYCGRTAPVPACASPNQCVSSGICNVANDGSKVTGTCTTSGTVCCKFVAPTPNPAETCRNFATYPFISEADCKANGHFAQCVSQNLAGITCWTGVGASNCTCNGKDQNGNAVNNKPVGFTVIGQDKQCYICKVSGTSCDFASVEAKYCPGLTVTSCVVGGNTLAQGATACGNSNGTDGFEYVCGQSGSYADDRGTKNLNRRNCLNGGKCVGNACVAADQATVINNTRSTDACPAPRWRCGDHCSTPTQEADFSARYANPKDSWLSITGTVYGLSCGGAPTRPKTTPVANPTPRPDGTLCVEDSQCRSTSKCIVTSTWNDGTPVKTCVNQTTSQPTTGRCTVTAGGKTITLTTGDRYCLAGGTSLVICGSPDRNGNGVIQGPYNCLASTSCSGTNTCPIAGAKATSVPSSVPSPIASIRPLPSFRPITCQDYNDASSCGLNMLNCTWNGNDCVPAGTISSPVASVAPARPVVKPVWCVFIPTVFAPAQCL